MWKILKEMGIPDHLTCLLRNQYVCQEATVRTKQRTGSKLGKEYKTVHYHPAYLTYMQSTSCEMPGWMIHKLESKLLGEISTTSRYVDDTTPITGSEKELKSLLMRVKEEREKASLKVKIQKTKIMASGPITSWQIEGENVEAVTDFSASLVAQIVTCLPMHET